MTDFFPVEKGTPIRLPSTANLMLDTFDRAATDPTPWNFTINRSNSILNGFFTRIGTTEVVLEWNQGNIITEFNDEITFDISGGPTETITLPGGFFTVADALDYIVAELNGQTAPTYEWKVLDLNGTVYIDLSGGTFDISGSKLQQQLGLAANAGNSSLRLVNKPDLRPWRYLDFVSSQLTYNQDLKDSSTCPIVRDVLCRWYFDWDTPPFLDQYGFPILMGYTAFNVRRLFNPPKQIKWDSRQPVGGLGFEVYGQSVFYPTGILLSSVYTDAVSNKGTNWLMTLQVSEV